MQLTITVHDAEADLRPMYEHMRGIAGVEQLRLEKTDSSAMSIHDTISLLVQNPEAAVAIAAGIGALFAALGNRAKVTVTKDGAVVAEGVSSRDAAKIVKHAVSQEPTPNQP